jgi:hypothetical protein
MYNNYPYIDDDLCIKNFLAAKLQYFRSKISLLLLDYINNQFYPTNLIIEVVIFIENITLYHNEIKNYMLFQFSNLKAYKL